MTLPPKTVVMLAYHYPPARNAGVERSAAFARYLPESGWQPIVVTTQLYRNPLEPKSVIRTPELLALFRRASLSVTAREGETLTGNGGRPASSGLRGSINRLLQRWLIPDVQHNWAWLTYGAALRAARQHHAAALYSTSPPHSTHLLGLRLKRATGRPWVMDLRDPWTIEPINPYLRESAQRMAVERRLEQQCMAAADVVILNTPEAEAAYRRQYPEFAAKMRTITNGYDADELAQGRPPENLRDGLFVISHIGSFSRKLTDDPTPYPLLGALARLASEGVLSPQTHRVVFAGRIHPATRAGIQQLGLDELVMLPGTLDRKGTMGLLQRSNLTLVYDPDTDGATYVRSKVYEYLGARKPMLALVPPGATRNLVERSGYGLIAPPGDEAAITEALQVIFSGQWQPSPAADFMADRYERRQLTAALAACLNAIVQPATAPDLNR